MIKKLLFMLVVIALIGGNFYFYNKQYRPVTTGENSLNILAPLPLEQITEAVEKYGNDFISNQAFTSNFINLMKLSDEQLNLMSGISVEFYTLLTEQFNVLNIYAEKYYSKQQSSEKAYIVAGFLDLSEKTLNKLSINELVAVAKLRGETIKMSLNEKNTFKILEFDRIYNVLAHRLHDEQITLNELKVVREGVQSALDLFGELEANLITGMFGLLVMPKTVNKLVLGRLATIEEMKYNLTLETNKFQSTGDSFDLDRLIMNIQETLWLHKTDLNYILGSKLIDVLPSGVYRVTKAYPDSFDKKYKVDQYRISSSVSGNNWVHASYSLDHGIINIDYGIMNVVEILLKLNKNQYYIHGELLTKEIT
jgi:hypothetical protein